MLVHIFKEVEIHTSFNKLLKSILDIMYILYLEVIII